MSTQAAVRNEKKVCLDDPKDRERILRQKRSKRYMDFLTDLDTGNVDMKAQVNAILDEVDMKARVDAILDEVREEFPLIEIPGDFIGYCSKCYLGEDFEVHTVDFTEAIIEHFRKNEPLPDGMEKARYLAMDENYEIIEVYTHCIRAIDYNGCVSVIEC
ncbi:MAG: hypothetical protein ACI4KF_03020 [Huintestinicola sp.]